MYKMYVCMCDAVESTEEKAVSVTDSYDHPYHLCYHTHHRAPQLNAAFTLSAAETVS